MVSVKYVTTGPSQPAFSLLVKNNCNSRPNNITDLELISFKVTLSLISYISILIYREITDTDSQVPSGAAKH